MRKKTIIFALFLVLILSVLSLSYRIYNTILTTKRINILKAESEKKYKKLKEEKENLKKELEEARKGENKERFIRDKLNMKKEGEIIYKIIDIDEQSEKENEEEKENNNIKDEEDK